MRLNKAALVPALCVALGVAGPALGQMHFWTGPYIAATGGLATGNAQYTFNTDGLYNDAPGDTFGVATGGAPFGGALGFNWVDGNRLFGIEMSASTAVNGIGHWDTPVDGHEFDLKAHWFAALTGRVGYIAGRLMGYIEAGPAVGHLIWSDGGPDDERGPVFGVALGAGGELALTPRIGVGFGYQFQAYAPLHIVNADTDHDLRFTTHVIQARIIYRFDRTTGGMYDPTQNDFTWDGFYFGGFAGAIWQFGGWAGYNFTFADHMLAGINVRGSMSHLAQGGVFTFSPQLDLRGRLGTLVGPGVAVYGVAGPSYSWMPVNGGFLFGVGAGLEVPVLRHISLVAETELLMNPGTGWRDVNLIVGANFNP